MKRLIMVALSLILIPVAAFATILCIPDDLGEVIGDGMKSM